MKEKTFNFTFCLLCIIATFFIFKHNNAIALTILNALNLFINKVFISLFPMFILNDLLISLNLPCYFAKIFKYLFEKIFHTSGICAYVLFMSLLSGTPSNAIIIKSLVSDNKISTNEANHYLKFTYYSNPLFLIVMLNALFPLNISIKIIIAHYLSNIIIMFIERKKAPKITSNYIEAKFHNIGSTITSSIKKSMNTLLMILGTITFYMLVSFILTSLMPTNNLLRCLTTGLLELTNGLNNLTILHININIKIIIATSFISFGGLSIHTQIKSILEDTPLKYQNYLKGRIMQTIISIILIILFNTNIFF